MHHLRLVPALAVAFSLLACGQSSGPNVSTTTTAAQPAPAQPAPVKKEIGLVMKTLTNPFFVEMERGARRAEQELGITLKVKTAAQETSIEQQIQLVEDLTAAKVAAIVIAPGDSQRLVPALKRAADAGIRIVNIDNRLDPDAVKQAGMSPVPFVSVDNRAGAHQAGKFLAEGINSTTEAAILEGIRSADNARQRTEGARAALVQYIELRQRRPHFANARSVRNALDRARLRQASRLFDDRDRVLDRDDLMTLTEADIRASRVFSIPTA